MAAVSAYSKGPFVFRRAHAVASLASTPPLVEEMIKTDVLLWFFLPSDVGRGVALVAALVKWAAENPKTHLSSAGGAVAIDMLGYNLERDVLCVVLDDVGGNPLAAIEELLEMTGQVVTKNETTQELAKSLFVPIAGESHGE